MWYGRALAIGLTLISGSASAQDCFLFFCRPTYQQPYGQQPYGQPGYGYQERYYPPGANGERFAVPELRPGEFNPAYARRTVPYPAGYEAGTIVVDAQNHFLYLV